MALTKSGSAITQLTASGTSTTLDVSASYGQTLGIKHNNGSGTVTVAALAKVQWKRASGSNWYDLTTVSASTTTSAIDTFTVAIPDAAASVQIVYTQPTGASGYALDAEIGTITGL
jgi:hypothetical protein